MLFSAIFGLLVTATFSFGIPTENLTRSVSLQQMYEQFQNNEACNLEPTHNCAAFIMTDVIVTFDKSDKINEVNMYISASKAAGGQIAHEYPGHGFSGFVPEGVLAIIEAHGKPLGLKVQRNACMGVPWCGEAPC